MTVLKNLPFARRKPDSTRLMHTTPVLKGINLALKVRKQQWELDME